MLKKISFGEQGDCTNYASGRFKSVEWVCLQVIESKTQFLLVGARGFEPRTPCAQGRCATRLRYAPT
jgi:hypothetical protein